jgi:hypothetical protein
VATSPRQGWPYPEENQDPFYDAFSAMVAAQDASVYALREVKDLLVMKGGTVSFVASSGLLTWSAAIELNSASTGFKWTIPAGSVNLNDGDYVYITLVHNPITNLNVATAVAAQLPGSNPDNTIILGLRNGDRVYFRDGKILLDGGAATIFSTMSSIGGPGEKWRQSIAMAVGDSNNSLTPKVMGSYPIDTDDYTLSGTTKTIRFVAVAAVDSAPTDASVVLYDLTAAAVVATLTFDGLVAPTKLQATVSIASTEHIYEVRGQLTAGTGTIYVHWAGLVIDNAIV